MRRSPGKRPGYYAEKSGRRGEKKESAVFQMMRVEEGGWGEGERLFAPSKVVTSHYVSPPRKKKEGGEKIFLTPKKPPCIWRLPGK